MRTASSYSLVSLVWLLLGCQGHLGYSPGVPSSQLRHYGISKILLLPLADTVPAATGLVGMAIQNSMQKRLGWEVVLPDHRHEQLGIAASVHAAGGIPAMRLLQLARTFYVQAVMTVEITRYSQFPPALGLRLCLVSAYDGSVLWTASAVAEDQNFYNTDNCSIAEANRSLSSAGFIQDSCDAIVQPLLASRK